MDNFGISAAVIKLQKQIECRDLIMTNLLQFLIDKDAADAYRNALTEADTKVDEALKEKFG